MALLDFEVPQKVEENRQGNGSENGHGEEPEAAKNANCGYCPDHSGGRKAVDMAAGLHDETGSEKSDAHYYVGYDSHGAVLADRPAFDSAHDVRKGQSDHREKRRT